MVKIGPKLPSPTRRELEKVEKEQKRIAQLQSGIYPAPVGEPRENLMYLLSASKRARVRHPKSLVVEEAKRKREKTKKRALARRAAKSVMKDIIACVVPGSKAHGGAQDDLHNGSDAVSGVSVSVTPITRAAPAGPLTIAEIPALPSSGQETDEHAAVHTPPESRPSVAHLLDVVLVEAAEAMQEDNPWKLLSPVILATARPAPIQSAELSGVDNDATSIPRLEIQISTETDTLWDDTMFTSAAATATAVNPRITEEIMVFEKSMSTSPERQQAVLTTQILAPTPVRRSSRCGSELLDPSAGSASQAPPRTRPVSKSAIFSEPLDYSKYSSKSSSTFSSARLRHSSPPTLYESCTTRRRGESRMDGLDRPGTPIPEDYCEGLWPPSSSTSRLPILSNVRLTYGVPFDVPMAPRAAPMRDFESFNPHGWPIRDALTKTPGTSEKPRYTGLSADDVALEGSAAIPQWPVPTTPAFSATVEGAENRFPVSSSPVDSILLASVNKKYPDMSRLGSRLTVQSGADYSRTSSEESLSVAQTKAGGSGQTPMARPQVTPRYSKAYQNDSARPVVSSPSFSSNMSSPCGSDKTSPVPSAALSAVFQETPRHQEAFVPGSNLTIRPLAPAASIILKRVRSGILAERNLNKAGAAATLDELERGISDANFGMMSSAVTDGTALVGNFKAVQQDVGYRQEIMTYPDTPLGERSGIVPPASTPVSRSPKIFSIALPTLWSRAPVLPTHTPHVEERPADGGGIKGFVLALKWALKRRFGYIWQRRRV